MNIENLENKNYTVLSDDDLENVAGGTTKYVLGDDGRSNVRTGPGLDYDSIGILYDGDTAEYTGKSAIDDRGVRWYQIHWRGRKAWVSSRYTSVIRMAD